MSDDGYRKPLQVDRSPIIPYYTRTPTTPTSSPGRESYNSVAKTATERQQTISGVGELLPTVYGLDRVGARVTAVITHHTDLLLRCEWCRGGIDGINKLLVDDDNLPGGVTFANYLGSQVTPDPWLVAAYAAQGKSYTDTLNGIAYSVIRFPVGSTSGFPRVVAEVRGLKVKTSAGGVAAYNQNPVWLIAWLITERLGRPIHWASFATAATDACDVLVGGEAKRMIGISLDTEQGVSEWISLLLGYAGCFLWFDNGAYGLTAETATTPTAAAIAEVDMREGILELEDRNTANAPTVVRVYYTNTLQTPWRDEYAEAVAPGAGVSLPYLVSEVRMPGIQRYSHASREAIERLNDFLLCDLSASFTTRDEGVKLLPGDIVTLTHSLGLSAKKMRVLTSDMVEPGRYRIACREFDPAKYSDTVNTTPSFSDTALPSPSAPTDPSDVLVAEEIYAEQDGTIMSRLRVNWTAADFAFTDGYVIEIVDGGEIVHTGSVTEAKSEYRTPPLPELHTYVARVSTRSRVGAVSPGALSANITTQGKWAKPLPPDSIAVSERSGEVFVIITKPNDPDIWRYRVKYGPEGVAWNDATLHDDVDSLRPSFKLAAGRYDILVRSIDSVKQESDTEARATVTVTVDASSFLLDTANYTVPTLTNVHEYTLSRLDQKRRFVTATSESMTTALAGLTPLTATLPEAAYHASATSTMLSEVYDFGALVAGAWAVDSVARPLTGAVENSMKISADGVTWTDYGASALATGRLARAKIEATGTDTFYTEIPAWLLRLNATTTTEEGNSTSSASAGTLVQLSNPYQAVKSISIQPTGSASYIGTPDRVLVAPVHGLQFEAVCASAGAARLAIYNAAAVAVATGDRLRGEVYVTVDTPADSAGGVTLDFTDSTTLATWDATPSNGTLTRGVWVTFDYTVPAGVVGKTVNRCILCHEGDTAGAYKAVYRNVRLENSGGSVKRIFWDDSGEPSYNSVIYTVGYSNVQCGPANSFLVYVRDASNNLVARPFYWSWRGV